MTESARTIIVGICGYKGSGKDIVAVLLASRFIGWEFRRLAFADEGKREVAEILGTTVAHLNNTKSHPLIRHILQWYMSDYIKPIEGDDVWIRRVAQQLNELPPTKDNAPRLVVITDVRFPHEGRWIKEVGGYLIMIERFEKNDDPHPSETEIDKITGIDVHIPNKGTMNALRRECLWVSQYIKERYKV